MKRSNYSQVLFGLIIIVIGLGFLLQSLGVWQFNDLLNVWWPVAIVTLGLASLISNPKNYLWPSLVIVAGTLLTLSNLGILGDNIWQILWPIAIITMGVSFLFRHVLSPSQQAKDNIDNVDAFALFSGVTKAIKSSKFKGGKISAAFGGVELDLTEVKFAENATLDIFTAFGGTEVRVPADCQVVSDVFCLFGGVETPKPAGNKQTLRLTGTCIFGGVEVKK